MSGGEAFEGIYPRFLVPCAHQRSWFFFELTTSAGDLPDGTPVDTAGNGYR